MKSKHSKKNYKYEMKPLFRERLQTLMPNSTDFENFNKIVHTPPLNFIRCNTLKISIDELFKILSTKWSIEQPFINHKEIFLINSSLNPGELGNAIEHQLGYYYIQEISSMMPPLALNPSPNDFVLDLFASPGSKTTQMAAMMENQGTLLANDLKFDRLKILSANLQRCGVSNTLVTKKDAISLCSKFINSNFPKFDKILLDVPCSGEGTLRSSPKTFQMWNIKIIKKLSRMQKKFLVYALKCLKKNGTLVYSTCTHSPEENESVISFGLNNFPLKIESLSLPLKCRPGISNFQDQSYNINTLKSCRIYPQDNNSEGFFLAKFTLLDEVNR